MLLDNANMCMATVLDRLNPLLEPAGALLLNEAGTANGRLRVLRPHPNFRLILALDPKSAPSQAFLLLPHVLLSLQACAATPPAGFLLRNGRGSCHSFLFCT